MDVAVRATSSSSVCEGSSKQNNQPICNLMHPVYSLLDDNTLPQHPWSLAVLLRWQAQASHLLS